MRKKVIIKQTLALLIFLVLLFHLYVFQFAYTLFQEPRVTEPLNLPHSFIPLQVHQLVPEQNYYTLKAILKSFDKNPRVQHRIWTDEQMDTFVAQNYPNLYSIYTSLDPFILKADLARYMILNVFGGIYSDSDTLLLKDVMEWVPAIFDNITMIIGVEADDKLNPSLEKAYPRPLQFVQWTFATMAHHPILEKAISTAVSRLNDSFVIYKDVGQRVMETTGPGLWTDVILAYLLEEYQVSKEELEGLKEAKCIGNSILILPIEAFGSQSKDPSKGLIRHLFQGSWKKKESSDLED